MTDADFFHQTLGGILDTAILIGLLFTAILTIFKAGRWFGGMMSSIDKLSGSMQKFKASFDDHVIEEDRRFEKVEAALRTHSATITSLSEKVDTIRVNGSSP